MKFRAFLSRRWRYIVYATTPVLVALLASGLTTLQDISPAAAATRVSVALLSFLLILFPTFISDTEDISNQGPRFCLSCFPPSSATQKTSATRDLSFPFSQR